MNFTRVVILHGAVFAALFMLQFVVSEYMVLSLTRIMVLAIYAVGYNLLFGYAGLLLADTEMRLGVVNGTTAELGREPNHPGLAFPDRRGQDNIRWCPGPKAAKARQHGFTLDRALAGRRQAAIHVSGETVRLNPLHERCATYVQRENDKALDRAEGEVRILVGDRVIAGTTVVGVRFPDNE